MVQCVLEITGNLREEAIRSINPKNKRLKKLLYSWTRDYQKTRDMRKYLVKRLSTNALLLKEDPYALRVIRWLKFREGEDNVKIYKIEEIEGY